ncbi:TetR/AcrR family transcriptional regulator [soil metagenome]
MATRAETAALTRRALLDATAALLIAGGPDAVTLRAVGARAGVSRGAPYGHFADRDALLIALAVEQWHHVADGLAELVAADLTPGDRLLAALQSALDLARSQPHLHELMYTRPAKDAQALVDAASASQDVFLSIVAAVVGDRDSRRVGALLLSAAHGIAGMELAGHLGSEKWGVTGDELLRLQLSLVTG